jgi:TBC1 domain family member 24
MNDDSLTPKPLSQLVIGSVDTLCGHEIPQKIPLAWNEGKLPLLAKYDRKGTFIPETERLLKGMLRFGIPPNLRCAVTLSNIVQSSHHDTTFADWESYRTLGKVRALDHGYETLLQRITEKQGDILNSTIPTFGRRDDIQQLIPDASETGRMALHRVLSAISHTIAIDHSPLIPTFATIFLKSMSESYAYTALREMSNLGSFYFPTSRREHAAWSATFREVITILHPSTAEYLDDRGVLDVDGLAPFFADFGIRVLQFTAVQRMMDLYSLEGYKVLFRFSIAIFALFKHVAAEQILTISNTDEWWKYLKEWAHSKAFDLESIVRKAYGFHGHGFRKQLRFPRRIILQRILRVQEERIRRNELLDDDGHYQEPKANPLGLLQPATKPLEEPVKAILPESVEARQHLAQWLPLSLRLTDLELIYSTNHDGRTLERFYEHVKNHRYTITLVEVLHDSSIVGMYASQTWRPSTRVYGDGGCFLFRLYPDAACWKWQPKQEEKQLLEDWEHGTENNTVALLEQFMVSTRSYISMGGNVDGTCGLRLNEDLTKAESSTAAGFGNDPLYGHSSVFDVGLVEVYGLRRQIDGGIV